MRDRIYNDLKSAMKSKNEVELSTLRLMTASIKELDIEARGKDPDSEGVDDQAILARFSTMIKQRRESSESYKKGGRDDLAEREMQEIEVISKYMPRQLDENETSAAIDDAITSSGASSIKDMGKVMSVMKEEYAGQMDFAQVSGLVKKKLADK